MERRLGSTFSGLVALSLLMFSMPATADWTTSYCSSQNTGSTEEFHWDFQSVGKCKDHCDGQGTFAFAVIQWTECWCSNYAPAVQDDTSGCEVDCPGYPAEKCGSKDDGLYIYIKLDGSVSGTKGAPTPTSTDVSSVPSSTEEPSSTKATTTASVPPRVVTSVVRPDPETVVQTVTRKAPTHTVYPSSTSTSSSSSSTTSDKSSTTMKTVPATTADPSTTKPDTGKDSPSAPEQPQTVPTVVTESGVIITRTLVITPTPAADKTKSTDGESNKGAIIGGVVGGVLGLLALVGGLVFLLWRRRKQKQQQEGQDGQSGLNRNTSTMSKAGLLGHATEKDIQYPTPIATTFGSQRSRYDNDSIGPVTPSDRRYSQPLIIDSRLDPRAVLTFHGANESDRHSMSSIDDSRDYGRQLNVVNPDPER